MGRGPMIILSDATSLDCRVCYAHLGLATIVAEQAADGTWDIVIKYQWPPARDHVASEHGSQ